MKKILFIGAGNMANAIAGGISKSKIIKDNDLFLYDKNVEQYSKFNKGEKICQKISL